MIISVFLLLLKPISSSLFYKWWKKLLGDCRNPYRDLFSFRTSCLSESSWHANTNSLSLLFFLTQVFPIGSNINWSIQEGSSIINVWLPTTSVVAVPSNVGGAGTICGSSSDTAPAPSGDGSGSSDSAPAPSGDGTSSGSGKVSRIPTGPGTTGPGSTPSETCKGPREISKNIEVTAEQFSIFGESWALLQKERPSSQEKDSVKFRNGRLIACCEMTLGTLLTAFKRL
jgi:hypothetical protein